MATRTSIEERPVNRLALGKILFVVAGLLSFLFSIYLWFFIDKEQGIFVGLWVPSIWSLGALLLSKDGSS
ncbi:MAG: hypothetical protein HKN46_05755 [Acidimicrobiia bacterium]|nr:hypothetical protein [Acidimicrobiia bacterium]